jgi:predicted enzyme related to lactoylglutathione lyase
MQMTVRSITYVEIPANDPSAAAKFYSTLFGWNTELTPEMDYYSFRTGDKLGGGFPKVGEMATAGDVILYLESTNINDDLRRIEGLGGKMVVPKTEIPSMGYWAIFTDPTGNRIGLFEQTGQ